MVIYTYDTPFVLFTFSIGSLFIEMYNTIYFLIVLSTLLIGLLYYYYYINIILSTDASKSVSRGPNHRISH